MSTDSTPEFGIHFRRQIAVLRSSVQTLSPEQQSSLMAYANHIEECEYQIEYDCVATCGLVDAIGLRAGMILSDLRTLRNTAETACHCLQGEVA